ncbi:hypothetical protein Bbelb_245610 [Branchiostoma belcheri]|nr:hypothetical protein Bbelb_245610 [Branchiostoma belcheri]
MEPYAVANMSDHMAYLSRTINMRQRASDDSRHDTFVHKLRANTDSKATDDGDMEPYAVTNMWENETYFRATTNVRQQASDDSRPDTTEHVKKLCNPPNARGLLPNPIYIPNPQQANKLCVNRSCLLIAFVVVLLLVGAITGVIMGVYHNTPGIQKDSPMLEVNNLSSTLNATEATTTAIATTNPFSLGTGGINGTNPPNLGTTDGTTPPSLGTTDGTTPPNLGTTDGTTAPSLGTTDGTNLPSCKEMFCEKENIRLSCAANELIVIDDTFCGRENGSRCGCTFESCDTCQYIPTGPGIKRYLEVTYHCEEVKKNVTLSWKERGPWPWEMGGLAVSSTNEIFVADQINKIIQVFSMKGVFLRSFPTGNMPVSISIGRNDTLQEGLSYSKVWSENGDQLSSFGSKGICVDSLGRVIVADPFNSRVEMFTAEGEYIRTVAYIKGPTHVATEDGARLPRMKLTETCNSILSTDGRHLGFRTPARQSCTLGTACSCHHLLSEKVL